MLTSSVDTLNTYSASTSQSKRKFVEETLVTDFDITAVCWHKVYSKMQLLKIRNLLNNSLTMQAEAYLEGILQIPTLRGMKKVKFDSQKFYDDCKLLFENVGWIVY